MTICWVRIDERVGSELTESGYETSEHGYESSGRVVSGFLSSRFHSKSRRLSPYYFSNIILRTDLLTFGVTGAVFKIAGEMRRLLAYSDNPGLGTKCPWVRNDWIP